MNQTFKNHCQLVFLFLYFIAALRVQFELHVDVDLIQDLTLEYGLWLNLPMELFSGGRGDWRTGIWSVVLALRWVKVAYIQVRIMYAKWISIYLYLWNTMGWLFKYSEV